MPSDATATIIAGLLGGLLGLAGVWIGFYLSRRAGERDRQVEALYKIYLNIEVLRTLLRAFQKQMINKAQLHRKWNRATEEVLLALIRSGLDRHEKKRVLHAINLKWEDPQSVSKLQELTNELLHRLDPEYAQAANEMLSELGVKPEDIDPILLSD